MISLIVSYKWGSGYSDIWIKKSSPFFNPSQVKRIKFCLKEELGSSLMKTPGTSQELLAVVGGIVGSLLKTASAVSYLIVS